MTLTHGAEGQHLYRLYLLGKSNIGLEREINMKGYKAFRKGLICKNKQYAENTIFKEPKAIPCKCGMHFCKNPMDVLDYYGLMDSDGALTEFTKVESIDKPKTNDNKKYCTTELKVYEKLSFEKFIDICINSLIEKTQVKIDDINLESYYIEIEPSDYHAQLANFRSYSQIVNSGYYSCIASSGRDTKIVNCGYHAHIASSGRNTKIGNFGDNTRIANSEGNAQIINAGNDTHIGNSGNHAQIGNSGNCVKIANSGNSSQIRSLGDYIKIANSGDSAQIRNSGDLAHIANSGFTTQIISSGKYAQIASSGNVEQIISEGEHSVICCAGKDSKVKAKKGSWITLSEWKYNGDGTRIPKCVKTEYVDGERIKEDTFYMLVNGEFVEAI